MTGRNQDEIKFPPLTFFQDFDPDATLEDYPQAAPSPKAGTRKEPSVSHDALTALVGQSTGLVAGFQAYTRATAVRDHAILDFATALTCMGGLSCRGFYVEHRGHIVPPGIMATLLGGTGYGKEAASKVTGKVAMVATEICGFTVMLRKTGYSSREIFHQELTSCPTHMVVIDESGRKAKSNKGGGDVHATNVETAMVEWYTKFPTWIDADPRRDDKKSLPMVHHPLLCGISLSQPEAFFEGMSSSTLNTGVLGRRLVMQIDGALPIRHDRPGAVVEDIPAGLRASMERILKFVHQGLPEGADARERIAKAQKYGRKLNMTTEAGIKPNPPFYMWAIRPLSDDVDRYLFDELLAMDARSRDSSTDAGKMLYARAGELVVRLAGLFALSDAAADPASDLYQVRYNQGHIDFAVNLVRASIELISPEAEVASAHGEHDMLRKRILLCVKRMCDAGGEDTRVIDGLVYVRRSVVKKSVKNGRDAPASRVTAEIDDLVDDESLISADADSHGRTAAFIRVAGLGGETVSGAKTRHPIGFTALVSPYDG